MITDLWSLFDQNSVIINRFGPFVVPPPIPDFASEFDAR